MSQTWLAVHQDDLPKLRELLNTARKAWHVDDLAAISVARFAEADHKLLKDAGMSYNFAQYPRPEQMNARSAGQYRYGHDGEVIVTPLYTNMELVEGFKKQLPDEPVLNRTDQYRLCYVLSGSESFDNRIANGQMRRMRVMLSQ